MKRKREPEPETHAPGEPFWKEVCACRRCGRLVTAEESVERGAGAKCYAHLHGQTQCAQLEEQGQLPIPFPFVAQAEPRLNS